jgi:hypothetical protein
MLLSITHRDEHRKGQKEDLFRSCGESGTYGDRRARGQVLVMVLAPVYFAHSLFFMHRKQGFAEKEIGSRK